MVLLKLRSSKWGCETFQPTYSVLAMMQTSHARGETTSRMRQVGARASLNRGEGAPHETRVEVEEDQEGEVHEEVVDEKTSSKSVSRTSQMDSVTESEGARRCRPRCVSERHEDTMLWRLPDLDPENRGTDPFGARFRKKSP